MKALSAKNFSFIIFLLLLSEALLLTCWNNALGWKISPVVLFSVSLLIGLMPLFFFYNKKIVFPPFHFRFSFNLNTLLLITLFISGVILISVKLHPLFLKVEITQRWSDVIPSIQVFVQRFLAGEHVYQPITQWGYYMPATYLPAHWMPFIPAELLHFDYRWVPFTIWCVAVFIILFFVTGQPSATAISAAQLFYTFLVLFAVWYFHPGIFSMTVEIMIAGYYMLAASAIRWRNNWLRAIPFLLCLLSRYSLVFWMPLFVLVIFFEENKLNAVKIALIIFAGIVLWYIVPFLSKDWMSFYNGYKYYDQSALGEWQHLNEAGLPAHLFSGTGFACYFYNLPEQFSLIEKIKMLQRTHLIVSILSIALLAAWYFLHRKNIDHRIFLLCSLKIYLTVFYAFIQVPYLYLFMVPLFISVVVVFTAVNTLPSSTARSTI